MGKPPLRLLCEHDLTCPVCDGTTLGDVGWAGGHRFGDRLDGEPGEAAQVDGLLDNLEGS